MENWNIVEILKLGLPGLVFLLSMLSYRLLSKEQEKEHADRRRLSLIKYFMCINFLSAILTLASPIIENLFFPSSYSFDIEAKSGIAEIPQEIAKVCQNAGYTNRYLLIKDKRTQRLIQVFANQLIPCTETSYIVLSERDANNLGWDTGTHSSSVEVVTAPPGCKFVL